MNLRNPMSILSSSPSAMKIRFTGSLPITAFIDVMAFSTAISGPLELVAPRPMITRDAPSTFAVGPSTIFPSKGGAIQTSGCVTGIVSYCQ